MSKFVHNDGGRAEAGYKGVAGDCTTRAIAIATGKPYQEVYDAMNAVGKAERTRKGRPKGSARTGVSLKQSVHPYLSALGWTWVPTMAVGKGCKVHLRSDELPAGPLIVRVSKHMVAVIDGVINDIYDPSRGGTRCVYGYWRKT
jgi:hypothetical protein